MYQIIFIIIVTLEILFIVFGRNINMLIKKKKLENYKNIFPIIIIYNGKNINLKIEKETMKDNFDKYNNNLVEKITYFFNNKPAFCMIINNELYDYKLKILKHRRIIINENYKVNFNECYKIIKKAKKKYYKERECEEYYKSKKENLF